MASDPAANWPDVVTWGLVLIGWGVVRASQLSQERRKENREAVARVMDEIKEIESIAIRFHSSTSFCAQTSDGLIWRVGRLNRSLQRPPLIDLNIPLPLMVRFKKRLTLRNMDASSFVQQAYHDELIVGVRQIADEIIEAIEAARDKKYQ